jgi:hypothetical protein
VIYSAWISDGDPTLWADTAITLYGNPIRRRNIPAPGITTAVLNQGVVLSYVRFAGGATPYSLPFTFFFNGGQVGVAGQPALGRLIYIIYNPITGGAPNGLLSSGLDIRYVIIPGGVAGGKTAGLGGTSYSAEQLKAMSYEQITSLFKIPANGQGWK